MPRKKDIRPVGSRIRSFYVYGNGPPVVFLPGAQGHPIFYEPAVRSIAHHYRVFIPILPGDEHRPVPKPLRWDTFARPVLKDIEETFSEPIPLIGTSFGAALGLWLLFHHPYRFLGAVLHAPPWRLPRNRFARTGLKQLIRTRSWTGIGLPFRLWSLLTLAPEVTRLNRDRRKAYRIWCLERWRRFRTPTRVMGQRIALVFQLPEALAGLKDPSPVLPVFILTSRPGRDRLVPPGAIRDLTRSFPRFILKILPQGGHLAPWIYPESFAGAVVEGLRAMAIRESPNQGLR